ncbi:major facilitator superfamily MFS_1 [Pseudarthrobacter chlorophenolicus A6]|uniref:Major facilitator superfamily MFS_1 n=1 Tax=Pseudarthrobacter chlorophenolicus (strain ATCC 700700 / DSM 12829 / CIP 107037 / JCM 12360 / KCTC 9906 / NCIMB 13794 / A6) TaxID=452863 RepID=B8H7K8_PSECP|nr:MFS transporter [Pseudarthrobacter chlorophenolicus]ACL39788.1 major facilitator superfamily MFS_1 [Pseudarthrobacter chlorophenolicus A6]SDQ93703.1 Predicted arabinose efflux permease, MFS family [Pseudarthrobacter chlorophenolicus]
MAIMAEHEVARVQRRTVALLAAAQVFGGVGTGATVSIGSILAVDLSGSSAWAGAVATVMTLGAALTALPLAALADRRGRRAGQVAGMLAALAGAILMVLSVVTGVFVLLMLGAAGIGAGTAANLQARFAAVDLADAGHRGRALATVVWAVTIGAVAGPNLIQPGAAVGQALGLPPVAGPFVISSAGLLTAIILVSAGLRPDPLLLARELAGPAGDAGTATQPRPKPGGRLARGMRAIRGSRMALLAVAAVVGAHAVMVGVMSMTPLHLQHLVEGPGAPHAGHAADGGVLVIIGFTISLHIAGMFALSPVMGWLTDKAGRTETIMLGFATLIAGVAVAGFGQESTAAVAAGLVLLGLGWSASTVAGSTLLAESVKEDARVVVQGVSDMLMGAAGAVGGAASGLVLSGAGYFGLNMLAGAIAACVLAAAAIARISAHRQSAAA